MAAVVTPQAAGLLRAQAAEILQVEFPDAPAVALAARTAVALLVCRQLAPEVPREDVLGDVPPGDVLEALEAIAGVMLSGFCRDDDGAAFLDGLGVAVAYWLGDLWRLSSPATSHRMWE